jgi:zinc protease
VAPVTGRQVAFGNKDGAVQSVINISYPVDMKPGSADAIKSSVMNSILGGGIFSGRLDAES